MQRKSLVLVVCLSFLLALAQPSPARGDELLTQQIYLPLVMRSLSQPVLMWAYGGCYSSWCETGWYSSPAVADINGDGRNEIIASAYSLWALDGTTGKLIWRAGNTAHRSWPGVVVADIDKDGKKEIVIAQSGNIVSVYNLDGSLRWQKQYAGGNGEFRGLLVTDLDGNNGPMEIVVTRAYGSAQNTWVLDASGNVRSGGPRLPLDDNNPQGSAWGVYNANAAAGNLSGDGRLELIVPSDVTTLNAYEPDGSSILANASDYQWDSTTHYWGEVGTWENLAVEKRGWGECNGVRSESYRTNFADGPAVITDVNGDGQREVIVTGNMYQCTSGYPSKYMSLFLFNPDRSRFNTGGYNWQQNPVDTGAPIQENYNVIESVEPNPVVADLDGDGKKEILYASYDGRLHAFWLDKTEHGSWPYAVYKPAEGIYRFASEPLVADLDNDGKAEVIFTSWAQKGSHQNGKLHILSWDGKPIFEINLPAPRSSSVDWNGAMAAPTLANVDGNPDLELIVNTANSGVVVYKLAGTANARILWGTGRGSFQRDASK